MQRPDADQPGSTEHNDFLPVTVVRIFYLLLPFAAIPKARPRFARSGHTYTPKKTLAWEDLLALRIREEWFHRWIYYGSMDGVPIHLVVRFHMTIPKSRLKKLLPGDPHTQKPDLDNLVKSVKDAVVKSGFLKDDAQVCSLTSDKKWGTSPRVEITMYREDL